jgi:antitoxin component YwqK of YwqJK toxin-antitoxin module
MKSYEQHYVNGAAAREDTEWYRDGRMSYQDGTRAAGALASGRIGTRRHHTYGPAMGEWSTQRRLDVLDPNGKKQYESHYVNGKKTGPDWACDEMGKLMWSMEFCLNDELVSQRYP